MRPRLSFAGIVLIATACNSTLDRFDDLQGGVPDSGYPNTGWGFDVLPQQVHFGVVRVGEQRADRVSVTNNSIPPALVTVLSLGGPGSEAMSAPNTVLGQPITVDPGATLDIDLEFMPSRVGRHEGLLSFNLCGVELCAYDVELAGDGVAVEPSDFLCQSRETVTLLMSETPVRQLSCLNASDAPVTVTSIVAASRPYAELTVQPLALPVVVPAGAPFDFELQLRSGTVTSTLGTTPVTIQIDDGSGPRSVEIDVEIVAW